MAKEIESFRDFKLNPQILNALSDQGITVPTPIQKKAIPVTQAGQDVIGIAQTGTGKTLAFLLPIIMNLKFTDSDGPRAIIMAPSRELAIQIHKHGLLTTKNTDLKIVALYGGLGPKTQIEELEKGADIIVATPGRFMELYLKEVFPVKQVKFLVIDEADRMMDMGFMPQLRKLFEVLPVKRQNLLFSATFSHHIEKLTEEFLDFPVKIEVTPEATPAQTITQKLFRTPNLKTKINLLEHLLETEEKMVKVIVFTKTKKTADDIGKFIQRKFDDPVGVIHANKGQNTRINAIKNFESSDSGFLVGTDVSCRGIDINDVSHVINFDVPRAYEDYVHRIGRTGRAEKEGISFTFANDAELMHLQSIEELIRMKIPVAEFPEHLLVADTPFHEQQSILKEIDHLKRKRDPNFKGAFHDRKPKK